MPDRPAAELLAEWRRLCAAASVTYPHKAFRIRNFEHVLVRLARAEQALAALEELADDFDAHGRWASAADIRAALRASKGGNDG